LVNDGNAVFLESSCCQIPIGALVEITDFINDGTDDLVVNSGIYLNDGFGSFGTASFPDPSI